MQTVIKPAAIIFIIAIFIGVLELAPKIEAMQYAKDYLVDVRAFTELRASHVALTNRVSRLESLLTRVLDHVKIDESDADCFPLKLDSVAGTADCKCCKFVKEK